MNHEETTTESVRAAFIASRTRELPVVSDTEAGEMFDSWLANAQDEKASKARSDAAWAQRQMRDQWF